MDKAARLINWSISSDKCLHGNVANHPKLSDGMYINTTPTQKIEVNRADKCIEVQTHNTTYILPFEHCCFDRFLETSEVLLDCISGESLDLLTKSVARAKLKKDKEFKALSKRIGDNQYYLVFSTNANYYFDTGAYKSRGVVYPIVEAVHVGTFQDSVILHTCCVDWDNLSYFPFSGKCLEFYGALCDEEEAAEGTLLGYIKNSGVEPILIKFTWGAIVKIPAGEEIAVYQNMQGNVDESEFSSSSELYPAEVIQVDTDFDMLKVIKEETDE